MGPLARREGAQATIEFALVVPVLLLLLVGILDMARALNAYITVSNASREGARFATTHPTELESRIAEEVKRRAVPLDTSLLRVSVSYIRLDKSGYAQDGSLLAWPVPTSDPPVPVLVRVDTSYPWSAATFVVGQFFAGGTGSRTFATTSTMEMRR
jgi:Flp pilus assembly protein TadG